MADVTTVPCHGCRRTIKVPTGPLVAAKRYARKYVRFCSRKCELKFIAREGTKKQEEVPDVGHLHTDSHS